MTMSSLSQVPVSRILAAVAVSCALSTLSFAQKAKHGEGRELVEQKLLDKYKLSTFTPGRGPITTGAFLLVQKPGLEMVAAGGGLNATLPPTISYQDGRLTKMKSLGGFIKNSALRDRL